MAPSTPPPPNKDEFAALTMASTSNVVMSAWIALRLAGTASSTLAGGPPDFLSSPPQRCRHGLASRVEREVQCAGRGIAQDFIRGRAQEHLRLSAVGQRGEQRA